MAFYDFYARARAKALIDLGIPAHYFKTAGERIATPYEQTYQRQASTLSPMNTGPEVSNTWDEHDKRLEQQRMTSEDTKHNT